MKYTLLLLTTLLFLSINTHAQRTKVETSITGGYIEQFAPSGRGWHGGLNFYARAPKKLKLDIQFSINNANDRDEMGSHFAINRLAGLRYYINPLHG